MYVYIYIYIDLLVRRRTNHRVLSSGGGGFEELRSFFDCLLDSFLEAATIFRKVQRLWEQPLPPAGSNYLEAAEASGEAIARLQRLWEQPSRGSRGSRGPSGSDLSFLEFSRVFSSLETSWGALPTAPGGSRRPAGGLEPAQEGFSVTSSGLKSAPRWLGTSEVASSGLKSA